MLDLLPIHKTVLADTQGIHPDMLANLFRQVIVQKIRCQLLPAQGFLEQGVVDVVDLGHGNTGKAFTRIGQGECKTPARDFLPAGVMAV